MRSRNTAAMLCQLDADDTLVPPNLRTTQGLLSSVTEIDANVHGGCGLAATLNQRAATSELLIVFENVFELFFELTFGENVLDTAPRRFAALAGGSRFGPTLRAFYQRIEVMGFFGFAKKLIVDIEMFVFAFAHCSRKTLEINGIDQLNP
jgi:hypothetical protein